jgi:hypothetical protein
MNWVDEKNEFVKSFFELMSRTIPKKYIIAKLEIQTASLKKSEKLPP